MNPYYEHAGITIYPGDCREVLPGLDVGLIVTDPPYGIGLDPSSRWPWLRSCAPSCWASPARSSYFPSCRAARPKQAPQVSTKCPSEIDPTCHLGA